ncbi:MAG: peptidase S41 [Calditerrivibrio nitroreducens]|uniref:Peptidase S41 n=1 Tax=Calditerrivibrio nitroreducens TaxID=477976 RepID=A0A2J6WHG9_9BACT|nr:MAG: peptidase S41 [Calditerrivibrio nitroreducens]
MKNRFSKSFIILGIGLILVLGIFALLKTKSVYAQKGISKFQYLEIFSDAFDIVERKYVEPIDTKKLIQGAIKGMLSELDPHSNYMDEKAFENFKTEIKGEFGGLGITIGIKDKILTIIAPIEDTPAYRAGLKAGDKIIKIDGKPTSNITIDEAVNKLRGTPGTSVTITILRSSMPKPFDVTLVREIIKVKTVKFMEKDDIGYLRLTQFNESASSELSEALDKLKKDGVKGLILDLRNNPGGLLDEAVNVASMFIKPGKTVVFTKERNEKNNMYLKSKNMRVSEYELPMVVLINGGSASASEIVSGALQDYKRAVIMGTTSFGKASVQTTFNLSDGSAIKLTTAKYYTPSGRSIQGVGIKPDIEVKSGEILYKEDNMNIKESDLENHLIGDEEKKNSINNQASDNKTINDNITLSDLDKIDFDKDLQLKYAYDFLKGILIYGKKTN